MILITSCAAQPPANQTIEMYEILFPSWVVAIYLWKPTLHATRCRHSGISRVEHHHWGSHAVPGRWAFCWQCSWGGQCPVQQHIRLECCRTRLGNAHRLGGQSCRRSECPAVRCPPLQECNIHDNTMIEDLRSLLTQRQQATTLLVLVSNARATQHS